MEIIIALWIVSSVGIAAFGTDKRIGYLNTLLISLFFSPIIGLIAALTSPSISDIKRQEEILQTLKKISQQNEKKD